jgi:hypothetical protein
MSTNSFFLPVFSKIIAAKRCTQFIILIPLSVD